MMNIIVLHFGDEHLNRRTMCLHYEPVLAGPSDHVYVPCPCSVTFTHYLHIIGEIRRELCKL